MKRRDFLATLAATSLYQPRGHAATPFPVKFRQQPPYAAALGMVEPGLDEFPGEKVAMEMERGLREGLLSGAPPVAPGCAGRSPEVLRYEDVAPGVRKAVFGQGSDIRAGWQRWRESLGTVRSARFYRLPDDIVRYDIRGGRPGQIEQRVGRWRATWQDGALKSLEPLEEVLTFAQKTWFRDVSGHVFRSETSFLEHLAHGVPHWRGRLDPACGIDLYGENGIAAGDIDGDGIDEIYVCQPGGLPNRLYKNDGQGRLRDIAAEAGLDLLDDTACALFVDLRNSGRQDLVVVRTNQVLLFFNDGKGHFTPVENAFRFRAAPQGSFTSVAAADFDRDGRLDLYLCCYVYYQSEAQYRYPVPYHDAQNGPPNFLFRNRLNENPGYFEDVTQETGIDHNNTHFSFAATWCDYNADGWPDLYVTNDFGRKNLYRNTNGKFRDVAEEAGVVDLGPGMSAAWLDYDGDGRPDLLVSNMWSACGQRVVNDPAFGPVKQDPKLLAAYRSHVKGDSLYHNNGDGTFSYTGDREGVEIVPWSWSCDGTDFDNDGTPELYIACGMLSNNGSDDLMSYFYRQVVAKSPPKFEPAPAYENGWNAINQLVRQEHSWAGPEPNVFFARRGGRYYDFSEASGVAVAEDSRAFTFTDIDGDGNIDLIVKSRLGPQVRVFQNCCGVGKNTLTVSLRGVRSNRDAIGARVELDGQAKWLAAGSAYLSQHSKKLHFGLGEKAAAGTLKILWPSGERQEFSNLAAGFHYEITEGEAEWKRQALKSRVEYPTGPAFESQNRAKLHDTWLWEPVPLPEKRRGPALLVVHAGEPLPELDLAYDRLDIRSASPELAAGYSIFRRYLFDYRVDLETPLWLLVDGQSRLRKVYGQAPSAATAREDLKSLDRPLPDARGLPFAGRFTSTPRRDYYKFGGALLQAGYPEQALPYLEEMLRRTPDNPKALLAVGHIHSRAKRLDAARAALRRVIEISPNLAEAWNEMGGVENQAGNTAEALKAYERALAIQPALGFAQINAAEAHAKLGHTNEAEALFRRALTAEGTAGDAANGLGLLMARQGRNDEARRWFEQAITVRRDDASAINNLGVLYMTTGKTADAMAAFQYGISVAPQDETLYLNLARIYLQQGERSKARDLMQKLLEQQPTSAIAERALRELGQ